MRMPETPRNVVHDDLNYASTLQRFEVKDLLMMCRLSAAGLDYIYLSQADTARINLLRRPQPREFQQEEHEEIFQFDL